MTAFLLTVGIGPLDPRNLAWILGRLDPTQHYLGWMFYRHSDWSFPIGLNPHFGLDLSSSIVYSDSIPLLAIPLKVISPYLPEHFQYFGIWLLACFVLQSWFAWKIVCVFTNSALLRLLACGLFIFSPPMLWRLNTPAGGHAALVGHFLILWAIYLALHSSQSKRTWYWTLLLSTAVLVHFYLFVIVAFIWLADLANRYLAQKEINSKLVANEILAAFVCVGFLAWQAGYFTIAAALNNERGYGFYGMNLLGPFDPQGWSYVYKGFTDPSSWGEGFSYMGAGVIAINILALIGLLNRWTWAKDAIQRLIRLYPFLVLLIIFLFAFALSHHLSIGNHTWILSVPIWFLSFADIIRSSARMFWPVYYLLVIGSLAVIFRCYSKKTAYIILALCVALQVIDTNSGWGRNHDQLRVDRSQELHPSRLHNTFWNDAATHYSNLMLVPAIDMPPNWDQFAIYAANHHMKTNAIHMARIDIQKQEVANQKLDAQINTGKFNEDTLYILENRFLIAALASSPSSTAIAKIDTFNVVAPNWNSCKNCPEIDPTLILTRQHYASKLNEPIYFSTYAPNRSYYLRSGWSWSESWGTWSDSDKAVLNLPWPTKSPNSLELTFNAFVVNDKHPTQKVDVLINGNFYKHLHLSEFQNNHLLIPMTEQMKDAKYLTVDFLITDPARPADLLVNVPDKRKLGIGIISAIFR